MRVAMEAVVDGLDHGEVVSYADVAARAGYPRAARTAGSVLASCPDTLPWWRVVYSDGRFPLCNPSLQSERLTEEGVVLNGFRVIASPKGRFSRA